MPSIVLITILLLGLAERLFAAAPLPDPTRTLAPPSKDAWFGTDAIGVDVFARTLSAAATDIPIALLGTFMAAVVGIPLGLAVGINSAWSERAMRCLDGFQAFPILLFTIAVVVLAGNSAVVIPFAIAVINIPRYMRLLRSACLSLREKRFVEAATAAGSSNVRTMRTHLLPHLRLLILSQTSLTAANALVIVSALGFLGVGMNASTPSWGVMMASGATVLSRGSWWTVVFPAAAMFVCVYSLNRVSDALTRAQAGEGPAAPRSLRRVAQHVFVTRRNRR